MNRSPVSPGRRDAMYETPAWKLQQTDLVYAGLAGIAIVFVQDFVGLPELDASATVSVLAFALALPLLAALGVLNALQAGYRYHPYPWWMTLAVVLALGASTVGIVAAFWYISAAAAAVLIASGLGCGVLVIAYRIRLDKANPDS